MGITRRSSLLGETEEKSNGASAGILARLRAFSRLWSITQSAKLRLYHEFFLHSQRFRFVKQARNLIKRIIDPAAALVLLRRRPFGSLRFAW